MLRLASIVRINSGRLGGQDADGDAAGPSAALAQAGQMLLELLPLAVFIVSTDARLLHANPCGHGLIGTALQLDGEHRCCAHSAASTFVLRSKIAEAAAAGRPNQFALGRGNGRQLAAWVLPIPPTKDIASPLALLVASDADRPCCVAPEFLEDLFGLTTAEARLALAVSNGRRLEAIAAEYRISMNTVRCHLKQIFAKLDIGRQADLVRLVLSGPGALAARPRTKVSSDALCGSLDLGQTTEVSAEDRGGPCVRSWSSDSGAAVNSEPCRQTTSLPSSPPAPGDPTAGDN
jgi:DNA-binding CsgD family transcriptional regulator